MRRIALAAAVVTCAAACAGAAGAATSRPAVSGGTYTGLGFDTCTAPSLTALSAWLSSTYRAVGIYIGGVNRACADGNLSASWVQAATAGGWSLIPLYVGLQAPCVLQKGLTHIDPATAGPEGKAAADDAVRLAQVFGLGPGVPIYFDMEAYATDNSGCTGVVRRFVTAWVSELHLLGYVAGIYGSAASAIRDMVALAATGSAPDQIDIGNWNKNPSVFGDPNVPDTAWPNHQRIHQYRGGHEESFSGVPLNIDNDALDGAVATAAPSSPVTSASPAGTATSPDGQVKASWPAGALAQGGTVSLASSSLAATVNGFAAGSYTTQLTSTTTFAKPLKLRFLQKPPAGVVPATSVDGQAWVPLLQLSNGRLPARASPGYTVDSTGNVTVLTTVPAWFGLLQDVAPPSRPVAPYADLTGAPVRLYWAPSQDNSGSVAGYEILRNGVQTRVVQGTRDNAAVTLDAGGRSVFRVAAVDAAGNASAASGALVVVRRQRPYGVPAVIPAWTWRLFDWQKATRRSGRRPATPHPLPSWYWRWASWVQHPYRITRNA